MAFNDKFRLSSHAVITNAEGQVLLLKANYGQCAWGLPGGALELGETIHQALVRECQEELGLPVEVGYLSGVYYHSRYQSQVFIFRCYLVSEPHVEVAITLSDEHSEYAFHDVDCLSDVQQCRVRDCLNYSGVVVSAAF